MNKIIQMKEGEDLLFPIGYAQGGMKNELLWTNPNPTSQFVPQVVNVNTSDYSSFVIIFKAYTTYQGFVQTEVSNIKGLLFGGVTSLSTVSSTGNLSRTFTITNDGFSFDKGHNNNVDDNSCAIPYLIYGIKTSYIVPTEVHGLTYIDDDTNGNITLMNNDGTKALYPHGQIVCLDETKVLASGNLSQVFGGSYTTTEDCFVLCQCAGHTIIVDGVVVLPYFNTVGGPQGIIPLKKGKTITSSSPVAVNIIAYGVKH